MTKLLLLIAPYAPYILVIGVFGVALLAVGLMGVLITRLRQPPGRHHLEAVTGRHSAAGVAEALAAEHRTAPGGLGGDGSSWTATSVLEKQP